MVGFVVFTLIIAFLYILFRNDPVYKFRVSLIKSIEDSSFEDAKHDLPWEWRFVTFNKVSYYRMVFSLKRLKAENFWKDTSFLKPVLDNENG